MTSSRVEALLKQIARLNERERRELLARLQSDAQQTSLPLMDSANTFKSNTLTGQPDIVVIFDGGSQGNPGSGYGSYGLKFNFTKPPSREWEIKRLRFGDDMTNNEAEYATLLRALDEVQSRIEHADRLPQEFSIEIRGDSSLVINQVTGEWKAKDDRMRRLREAVRRQLTRFKSNRLIQHPREESVKVLGH
jgi:ribonuclease HI